MTELLVLVPSAAARRIREGGSWGRITFQVSDPDRVGAVIAVSSGSGPLTPTPLLPRNHFLCSGHARSQHRWYRAGSPDLHGMWTYARNLGHAVPLDLFKDNISGRWMSPSAEGAYVALTVAADVPPEHRERGVPEITAWYVTTEGAGPVAIDLLSDEHGFAQLAGHWPADQLMKKTVMLVGAGSIGGSAAQALASYGVGRIVLVDPDRLLGHNVVRHIATAKHVGRLKVDAVKLEVAEAWPATTVDAKALNVVADAHLIRKHLAEVDVVLCTADGVAARRVVSHLSRRAQVDAVLACVLQDGGIGEIIRLRPWSTDGCLTCRRDSLVLLGAMNPEPGIDLGYGTGTTHRPMTAVGGDLHFVGRAAAKAVIATVLERLGHSDQKLPGEHAVIGLRPAVGWVAPFDLARNGDVRWLPASPPLPGCPTCAEP